MTEASSEVGERIRVQSVERAIALLRAVATAAARGRDSTASHLAADCGLNRATAWRILKTLETQGMVIFNRETERYSIGPTTVELGQAGGHHELIASARPTLERISRETGETAALAASSAGVLTYLDEVLAPTVLAASWVSRPVPLHATSTGKVLLAFGADSITVPSEPLERFTDATLTEPDDLLRDLQGTRVRGYAICRGEYEVTLFGVSAPIFDLANRPCAVMSLWGSESRFDADRIAELGNVVSRAAMEVSRSRLVQFAGR